mgnify:CR=1 FL=1
MKNKITKEEKTLAESSDGYHKAKIALTKSELDMHIAQFSSDDMGRLVNALLSSSLKSHNIDIPESFDAERFAWDDIADYCDVDPVFGSLDDFIHLLDEAHKRNIKVVIDQVWSHTSEEHVWFKKSRSDRTNEKADWYVWADPKPDGTPPNNWLSYFGGPAWTFDTRRQQYYLHHFLKEQPALNLRNPEVLDRIKKTGAFWLDMGVDGFRLDVAHTYYYDPELRDNPVRPDNQPWATDLPPNNPMGYQKRIHSMNNDDNLKLIEELRAFINEWPDKFLLAEAGGDDSETVAAEYTQTGKRFHMAYSFGLVGTEMTKPDIVRAVSKIEDVLKDGWVCWATGNPKISNLCGVFFIKSKVGTAAPETCAFCFALSL